MNSELHEWIALTLDEMEAESAMWDIVDPTDPTMQSFLSVQCVYEGVTPAGWLVAAFDDDGLVRCEFVREGEELHPMYVKADESEL